MVFKVKQRAKKDYKKYRNTSILKTLLEKYGIRAKQVTNSSLLEGVNKSFSKEGQIDLGMSQVDELYGMNWPYDNFSLVEKAKLDITYEVEK